MCVHAAEGSEAGLGTEPVGVAAGDDEQGCRHVWADAELLESP